MWAAITSHAHIWGFHGNVHIAWGVYYIGIIILHLIPCTLQNIDESVPVCLELKLCQSHALVRLSQWVKGLKMGIPHNPHSQSGTLTYM